ncbi:hypothetical protein ACKLNR_012459 [Fusarium oxysporum f. sp. zingiberi]
MTMSQSGWPAPRPSWTLQIIGSQDALQTKLSTDGVTMTSALVCRPPIQGLVSTCWAAYLGIIFRTICESTAEIDTSAGLFNTLSPEL